MLVTHIDQIHSNISGKSPPKLHKEGTSGQNENDPQKMSLSQKECGRDEVGYYKPLKFYLFICICSFLIYMFQGEILEKVSNFISYFFN